MTVKIELNGVEKIYQTAQGQVEALKDISLSVDEGEFLCIIGPSGCGKSTLLRILAGLYQQSAGDVLVHRNGARDRLTNAVVFQEYAIFPWRTVSDNVAFGLEMRGIASRKRAERTVEYLSKVGLTQFANHYPY
ncbi:ABC transporter ATP-binding protein, partial [Chloroflexota bacterium]